MVVIIPRNCLGAVVAAPFTDGRHEFFNGFLFRPEVPVQHGHVGDRSRALLRHQFLKGRMVPEAVMQIVGVVGENFTPSS